MTRKPTVYQYLVIHTPKDGSPRIVPIEGEEVVNLVVPAGTENVQDFVRLTALKAVAGLDEDFQVDEMEIVFRPFAN